MSKLILAVTRTILPSGAADATAKTIVVESDKITVLPRSVTTANDSALVIANGYQFEVAAEVAEIAAAMAATNASTYT